MYSGGVSLYDLCFCEVSAIGGRGLMVGEVLIITGGEDGGNGCSDS